MRILPATFFIVCILLIIVSAYALNENYSKKQSNLPELGLAKNFILNDIEAKPFNSDSLHGQIWLANFFFTKCQGICPTIMAEISKVSSVIDNSDFNIISISIDPKNDTLSALKDYSDKFKADQVKWKFINGDMEVINPLIENGFKVNPVIKDAPQSHSTRIVLIDRNFQIRSYYDGLKPNISKEIISDVTKLLNEG
jgi:protein SCO1/2